MGLFTLVVGMILSDLFRVGLSANIGVGLLLPIINGSFRATLQASIEPEMQGRFSTFIFSAALLVSPLALMVAGPLVDALGIQPWFIVAGISCSAMGLPGFFSSDVMRMESDNKHPGWQTDVVLNA